MNKYCCRACERLVLTDGIVFNGTSLVINLPADSYHDCQRYCILIADEIPATTTRGAPVVFTIGGGTVLYPFNDCCGVQMTQESISEKYRYMVKVKTTATSGSFMWLGKGACSPVARLTAIDGTAPVAAAAGGDTV